MVKENGHLRQAPYFAGGHKEVNRTGLVIVADCRARMMVLQDERSGKNYGGATALQGTTMSRALTDSICSDVVGGTDTKIRMF